MERLGEYTKRISGQVPGHEVAKYAWLLAKHADHRGGSATIFSALAESPRFDLTAPNVGRVLKAAVASGSTTDAGWAAELAAYQGLTRDWIESVAQQTLLGKLPYVRVPLLTSTMVQTSPFAAAWVEAGEPIPVNRSSLTATAMLQPKKVATIVPFTEETFERWTPATQANVMDAITRATIYASDLEALDPSAAATAARPGALTNGIAPTQSTGSTADQVIADLKAMLKSLVDTGSDLRRVVIAMSPSSALHLASLYTVNGDRAFPELEVTGGNIWGIPVAVTSAAVQVGSPATHIIAAIDGAKVLVADDGLVLFDSGRATTLILDDAPASGGNNVAGTRILIQGGI